MRLYGRMCQVSRAIISQFLPPNFIFAQKIHKSDSTAYLTVRNILETKKQLSITDWRMLNRICSQRGFGYQAFVALLSKDPGLAELKKLFSALDQENCLTLILKAQSLQSFYVYQNECTEEDHKYILDTVDEITNKFQILTPQIVKPLLYGVGVTSLWKEKCEYLGSKLSTADSCVNELSALAAFQHGEFDYAWDQLRKAATTSYGENCGPEVFHAIVESHKLYPNEGLLSKLLDFIKEFSLSLHVSVAIEIDNIVNKDVNRVSRFSTIDLSGHCSCCQKKLRKIALTSEERNQLLESVEKRFDVHCKFSTYEASELHQFKMFLKMAPPFTAVVDGANLYFRNKTKMHDHFTAKKTIKDLENRGHKVLLLGKNHMKGKKDFISMFKNHITYFVRNRSVDDAYVIYAAISSGPNTIVVSNDYYGTYYAEMPEESRLVFRKWQLSNQAVCSGYLGSTLVFPEFSPICQQTEDGSLYHTPIVPDGAKSGCSPSGWLCIQNVTKAQKRKSNTLWPVRKFVVDENAPQYFFRSHALQIKEKLQHNNRKTKSIRN